MCLISPVPPALRSPRQFLRKKGNKPSQNQSSPDRICLQCHLDWLALTVLCTTHLKTKATHCSPPPVPMYRDLLSWDWNQFHPWKPLSRQASIEVASQPSVEGGLTSSTLQRDRRQRLAPRLCHQTLQLRFPDRLQ